MKKIIILMLLVGSIYAHSIKYYVKQIKNINQNQAKIAEFIKHNASKYNLKYTALAIAWRESQWGRWKLNLADPSAGLFHELLPSYCCKLKLEPTKWNQSRLAEQLVGSNATSFMVFIQHFMNDYRYFRTKGYTEHLAWKYAVMAYNAGISGYKNGKKYYQEIVKIIKALKKLKY